MDLDESGLLILKSGVVWVVLSVVVYPFRRTVFHDFLALGLLQVMGSATMIGLPIILVGMGTLLGVLIALEQR